MNTTNKLMNVKALFAPCYQLLLLGTQLLTDISHQEVHLQPKKFWL